MYEELRARAQDKLFARIISVLIVLFVLGVAACSYYQIPLIG